jgi:hypothetical protein
MCSFTLKADAETYKTVHEQLLGPAFAAGMLFHSAHEVGNQVGVIDFWPSAEVFQSFLDGPAGEG